MKIRINAKWIIFVLGLCLMTIAAQGVQDEQQSLPPTTGNFFYAELKSDRVTDYDKDVMYVNVKVTDSDEFSLKLSTDEYNIGLISQRCRNCHVPNKYGEMQTK